MTVCTDADIVTTSLLAGNDELARRLVELKQSKNAYDESIGKLELQMNPDEVDGTLGKQKHALDLKRESVDMQIRQIVNYKILVGDKQAGAYEKLAKSMMEQGRNAGATISLLNKVDSANPLDLQNVAKYFLEPGESVADAVNRIKDNIANVGSAVAEQEKMLKQVKTVNDLVKEGKKTKEEIKEAMKKIEEDKKNIKEGLNPNNFAEPDSEWTVIKNTVDDVEQQHKLWGQYVLGKAILGDADAGILREIKKAYGTKNSVGKLLASDILSINSVDELIARAYTNVNDLVDDGLLRQAYKNRLTQLMTGMGLGTEKRLGKNLVDMEYAQRLITLSRFADEGTAFSSIVMHDAVGEAARKMGIKVNNSNDFYNALIKTLKEDTYLDNISKDGLVKLTDGTELTVSNMLELTYIATGDRALPRLLREGNFSESSLLDIGTQLLLGNKTEASKKILKLINKVKELPTIADSKDLALITLTGKKIQSGAKKAFFDYRSMYNDSCMLESTRLKADFMERMANANRAEISIDGLEDLSNLKGDALKKKLKEFEGGYIIVNDSGWMNNVEFKDALNQVNKDIKDESQKIQVIFPRQAQMSNFKLENGNLIYRSVDRQAFRDTMDRVSLRTLGDATATKELQADMFEAINGISGDRIRYQESLHGTKRKFDSFDMSHQSEGEGSSAYGYGIYLTKSEVAADKYANQSFYTGGYDVYYMGKPMSSLGLGDDSLEEALKTIILFLKESNGDSKEAVNNARKLYTKKLNQLKAIKDKNNFVKKGISKIEEILDSINTFKENGFSLEKNKRYIYTVEHPDDIGSNYLLWSSEISEERINDIKETLKGYLERNPDLLGKGEKFINKIDGLKKTGENVYYWLSSVLGGNPEASEFLDSIGIDGIHYFSKGDGECYVIFSQNKVNIVDSKAYQRAGQVGEGEKDMYAKIATSIKDFKNGRTVKEIADKYGIDINIAKSILTPEGEVAYGSYGYGIINIAEVAKESTAPHELFHAIFDIVDGETRNSILENSKKLFGFNDTDAEEALADAFSQWFRTGEFDYADVSKLTKNEQNTFFKKVKEFFKKISKWIEGVDEHRNQVQNLFDDMVGMKYVPDESSPVNQFKAIQKYNEELEGYANKYFASMLGNPEWSNPIYRDTLHSMLEDTTGIPIKNLRDLVGIDKTQLWRAVDTEFTNAQKLTGKFKNEVVDITERINQIENYSNEELRDSVSKTLNGLVDSNVFTDENSPLIKQALQDLESASNVEEWLTSKGRLLSLANGGSVDILTIDELKTIFRNGSQSTSYKNLFFPNQELNEEETIKYVKQINDMVFDGLTGIVAQNLVKQGYSLPLDNVRQVVLGYLLGDISLDDSFVKSFLYKNGLPTSKALMESVLDSAMPNNFQFKYEKELFKLREEGAKSGLISRIVEEDNPFLADTYSSLVSLINTNVGNIANGNEVKYLSSLLDSYSNKIKEGLKNGITFEEAQQLKTQIGYALDIFEQDVLMPKYGKFLTPDQRSAIRNMKSYLSIVVGKEGEEGVSKSFNELLETNNRMVRNFTSSLQDVLGKYSIIRDGLTGKGDEKTLKQLDKFKEKLKTDGAVVENVNGELVIVDAREQLQNNLDTIPSTIKGLDNIDTVAERGIDELDNRTVYYYNQLVESAKKLDAMSKWETAMMYTIDPELNMYRFFDSFRLMDDGGERIPMALAGNILSGNENLAKYNLTGLNSILRKDIFTKIKSKFYKDGAINIKELNQAIDESIVNNTSTIKQVFQDVTKQSEREDLIQQIKNQYQQAFMPYTHLKDIPSTSLDGITDVRGKINGALEEQVNSIREAVEGMPSEYQSLLNNVEVTTPTGQTITIQQFLDGQRPNWKKAIFDDEDILVKTADEFGIKVADSSDAKTIQKIEKENLKYRRKLSNQYSEVLQSIQNQQRVVSEGERKLTSRMFNNVRSTARKFSLTNRLVEATDMVSGLDEEASRMIKHRLLGWKNIISFGRYNREEPLKRLAEVQEAYGRFYNMGLDAINNISPKNEAEELAQHLCRYFKTLERHLGSADGAMGVTTRADMNRKFYNLGEVFMNIRDIEGIYALQSAIEQNQIFKFFRFSKPGQASYIREFTRPATEAAEDIFGGYREYVSKLPDTINVNTFNDIFASNFTEAEYKMLYQALAGVTYVGGYGKTLSRFLNFVNGSNFLFRFLISYPGQLLTIPQQGIAYFLKQKGFERNLGIEDMSNIDRIRNEYGTLVKAYNEINIFRDANPDGLASTAYYNRYGTPDIIDAYKGAAIELTDDVNDMYGKLMEYQSTWDDMGRLQRSIDAYKDNANNIVDGLFARNFKNIAFLKGIRENSFMQFGSAEAFEAFMKDNRIEQTVKNQLMDAVNASAGRNFRNILGLGFGGLDRAVGGSAASNIMYGLMQFFNFRGAWGQNIFRNMGETFKSAFKMLPMGTSAEGRNAIATYIAQTPEFTNFIDILFNDMKWTWKMTRYQDNGRWSELDNEYDILDFLDYSVELLNMTSQWWQGINSFGPARPILEAWGPEGSAYQSLRNPEVYKDVYGVGAFFNALGTNAGRNRKPVNYIFQAIQALEEGGPAGAQAYIQNQFWKLSFGSLRYMMNEDANDYGFTYEFMPDESGIPSIIRGEASLGSNKSFSYDLSNNNTWNAIQQVFGDGGWDEKKTYLGDIWGAMINGSNAWYSIKNGIKALPYGEEISSTLGLGKRKSPWSFDSFTDVIDKTQAGQELIRTGKVTPRTPSEVKAFINEFIDEDGESSNRSAYKPFGENFAEAISNYNQLGHIKGKEAHSGDKEMEFMLEQIRYQRGEDGAFLEKNGKKVETDLWKNIVEYIRLHPTDMDATSLAVSKEVFKWVEENNDDPNYLLYQSLIGQGMADMYLTDTWNKYQDAWNIAFGGKKAAQKITKSEAQNSGLYWDNFMRYLLNSKVSGSDVNLVEYLQRLDRKSAMSASIKIIKDQLVDEGDKANLERYVDFYKDSYGNEKVTLNSQYASQIEALGGIGDAIEKGNVELMMARASSFANTYLKEDETGLVKASAITSLINKVRESDISPKLKLEMIAALGENHAEFLQTHVPELASMLGVESASALVDIVNQHIYEWDGATNAAIGDAIMNGDGGAAKSGTSTSAKFKSALAVTSKLSSGAGTSGNGYGGRTSSNSTAKRVPYTLDVSKLLSATGGKGYSPKQTEINIRTFNPNIDLSIGKDISRKKKVLTTQEQKKSKVVL